MVSLGDIKEFMTKSRVGNDISIGDILKMASQVTTYVGMGKPDVLVGFVPLYNCKFFDVSISQDILKFRAVEAQFLAHQPATSYAMRIDFTLQEKQIYIISLLQAMYYAGSKLPARFKPQLDTSVTNVAGSVPTNLTTGKFPEIYKKGQPITTEQINDATKSIDETTEEILDRYWLSGDIRFTVPVIIDKFIFFDMYVESVFWAKNIEDGNIIKGYVLLRKYLPPKKLVISAEKVKEMTFYGEQKQTKPRSTIVTKKSRKRYKYQFRTGSKSKFKSATFQRIGKAVSSAARKARYSQSVSFNIPKYEVDDNSIKYTISESDSYGDMNSYINRDTIKQLIFLILSYASDMQYKVLNSIEVKRRTNDEYLSMQDFFSKVRLSDLTDDVPDKIDMVIAKGNDSFEIPFVNYKLVYTFIRFLCVVDINSFRPLYMVRVANLTRRAGYYFKTPDGYYVLIHINELRNDTIYGYVRVVKPD